MKRISLMLSILLIFAASFAMAEDEVVGVVKTIKGTAAVERNKVSLPLKVGDKLFAKDTITTGNPGSMGAILRDDSLISIGSNTRLVINEYVFKPVDRNFSSVFRIAKGTMTYLSGLMASMDSRAVRFETPAAVCGLRGTHLAIKVEDEREEKTNRQD